MLTNHIVILNNKERGDNLKKIVSSLLTLMLILFMGTVYAADEYSFDLEYIGKIETNVEKDATVTLTGVNGPAYTNVRIKVDVTGPATPQVYAYDSTGTKYDIVEIGYWGPPDGFAVQGSFTNRTPVKATFPKAGEYSITLSLIDIANSNNVITTRTIQLEVSDVEETNTTNPEQNVVENNEITEIPKTGWSFGEMLILVASILVIGIVGYLVYNKKLKI